MTARAVVLIRGSALNPFEMQAYEHVARSRAVHAVGSRVGRYEIGAIAIPHSQAPSVGATRAGRALSRLLGERLPAFEEGRLRKLSVHIGDASILHAAELSIPFSEQAARLAGPDRRLVLTCWETIPFRHDTTTHLSARKRLLLARADRFVAVTPRAAEALYQENVDPDRVRIIPAAIDTRRFAPTASGAPALRRRWGAGPDDLLLLFVGRLIQEKGVVQLVRAFAAAGIARAQLVFVGSGPETHRIRVVATGLGVSDRIHLAGALSYLELPAAYAAADLVAVPSLTTPYWEEQFGMVLAEAMASGRAIVASRSGAIPEVVADAAQLVEPYDVQELTTQIRRLGTDADLRATMGQKARARAVSTYALDVVGSQLEAMYAELD